MKKILYKAILISALLFLVVGCETVVEFKGDYVESLPVLNAVLSPDEPVRATYSRSVFILDDQSSTLITDGTVELYINDEFVEVLQPVAEENYWGTSYYHLGTVTPKVADKVTLRARSAEFPEWVSGTATIPYAPAVGDLTIETTESIEEGYTSLTARLELTDPEAVTNYYFVRGSIVIPNDNEYPYYPRLFFEYTDLAFREGKTDGLLDELLGGAGDDALFADTMIDGLANYPLTMECEYATSYWNVPEALFEVTCFQADEHLYKYLRSESLADNAAMFGEPVQIYTNVEGGLGVVCARSSLVVRSKSYSELFE
jgi:hypothetical protein